MISIFFLALVFFVSVIADHEHETLKNNNHESKQSFFENTRYNRQKSLLEDEISAENGSVFDKEYFEISQKSWTKLNKNPKLDQYKCISKLKELFTETDEYGVCVNKTFFTRESRIRRTVFSRFYFLVHYFLKHELVPNIELPPHIVYALTDNCSLLPANVELFSRKGERIICNEYMFGDMILLGKSHKITPDLVRLMEIKNIGKMVCEETQFRTLDALEIKALWNIAAFESCFYVHNNTIVNYLPQNATIAYLVNEGMGTCKNPSKFTQKAALDYLFYNLDVVYFDQAPNSTNTDFLALTDKIYMKLNGTHDVSDLNQSSLLKIMVSQVGKTFMNSELGFFQTTQAVCDEYFLFQTTIFKDYKVCIIMSPTLHKNVINLDLEGNLNASMKYLAQTGRFGQMYILRYAKTPKSRNFKISSEFFKNDWDCEYELWLKDGEYWICWTKKNEIFIKK